MASPRHTTTEGRYNHVCSLLSLFRIWKSGELRPQPYAGGDSSIPAGTPVTFLFRLPRKFFLGEFILVFPEEFEPDGEGQIVRWADYEDAQDDTLDPMDFTEPEYFVYCPVSLANLTVYRLVTESLPATVDEWLAESGSDLDYAMYITETIEPEWVYGEGWDQLQTFLDWANELPEWEGKK